METDKDSGENMAALLPRKTLLFLRLLLHYALKLSIFDL